MNFKQYFEEANIQRLTPEEETQVFNVVEDIWNKWRNLKPEQLPELKNQALSKDGYELIKVGSIDYGRRDFKTSRFKQKVLPVYINVSDNAQTDGAFIPHRNPKDDYILVDHNFLTNTASKTKLLSLVAHEVVHAVQHYRKMSERYQAAVKKDIKDMTFEDWANYYSEPLEKEAIFSEIDVFLRNQYRLLSPNPNNTENINKYLDRNREKFLYELNLFAQYPLENYIVNQELPLPLSLEKYEHFLSTILERTPELKKAKLSPNTQKKLQALRREFKLKLLNILKNLNEKEESLKPPSNI